MNNSIGVAWIILSLVLLSVSVISGDEIYRWKEITFTPLDNDSIVFGLTDKRLNDITVTEILENYIPANNVPTGISRSNDRIFMTLPRRWHGIPATVAYVRIGGSRGSSPSLHAYPDFRTNRLHPQNQPDSKRIVSVYKSRVCPCNRLWFVDTGVLDFPENRIQVQQPSIWIFDLRTDTLIRRYEIPTSITTASHGFVSITVDADPNRCDDAYAYLPDIKNYRLNVYSLRENQAWVVTHNFFGYNPLRGDFDIGGQQYQWSDGIFSTKSIASNSATYLGERNAYGQSNMHAYDPESRVLFYTQPSLNAIGCWNTIAPLRPSTFHLLVQNNETMIYPSDIVLDHDGYVWTISNRLPIYQYGKPNRNEYNFRIFRASARSLIEGTSCEYALAPDVFDYEPVYVF